MIAVPEQSSSSRKPERRFRRRAPAVALGLLGAGLIGFSVLAPTSPTLAQRADAPAMRAPVPGAPLTFADIVERVKPAVVSIHVTGGAPKVARNSRSPGGSFPDLPDDHPLNEFFKNLPKEFREFRGMPNARPTLAQGSGFVISADGYVVTNNHVVDGAAKIQISFDEQNKYEADLIGTDPRTDVALLKIKANKSFPHVKFAEKPVRVGDWVIAVGNPFGLGGTVTAGIVSALSRDIGSGPYDFLQIDAAVNRGNSGGPTFNLDGEVVGVNTAIYSPSGGSVGIAFAIPAKTASEVIDQLRSSGSVSRGWLGVKIENIDEDKAASLGMNEAKGALINEVTANGPASGSDLKAGDVVVAVNGANIQNSRDLARKIAEFSPGTNVNVEVLRFGKSVNVSVKLGTFPGSQELASLEKSTKPTTSTEIDELGLTLSLAPVAGRPAKDGVTISDVDSASDAAAKGLKAGDQIIEIQGQAVRNAADVESGVKRAKDAGRRAVLLRVKSGDAIRFVAVQIKAS